MVGLTSKASRFFTSKPGFSVLRLRRLCRNSPAPISSRRESETCATTRPLRNPAEPPRITAPAWSFKVVASFGRVDCSAGTRPKSAPASSEMAKVKPSTVQSGVLESESGVCPEGRKPISARSMSTARPTPRTPPAVASSRLSISSWRMRLPRPAPNASRTAISFCRAEARAISRFARFEQAISSTRPTIPIRANRGLE